MKLIHRIALYTFLTLGSLPLLGQSKFSPLLKIKKIDANQCRLRIVPQDFFEAKAMGLSGVKIKITNIDAQGSEKTQSERDIILDTFTRSEWKSFTMTPELAALSQLLFAKPKMYGASLVEQLTNAKKVQDNTYLMSFMATSFSWDAAEKGLQAATLNLSEDSSYVIQVSLLRPSPYCSNDSTSSIMIYNKKVNRSIRPFIDAQSIEKGVRLYWPKTDELIAYHIQEADLSEKNVRIITDKPYVNANVDSVSNDIYYDVPVERNYVKKKYRIAGFDIFGDSTIYSDWIVSYGRDLTPPKRIQSIKTDSKGEYHALLNWELPLDSDRSKIEIYHAHSDKFPNEKIAELNPNTTSWMHDKASNINENYYWVVTRDTAGNKEIPFSRKIITFDSIPPNPPKILNSSIDNNGLLTIVWASSDEEDLRGYKVGMSSSLEESPINLTVAPIHDTVFMEKIPLKNVKGIYYYFVRCQDLKGNIGEYCQGLEIKLPDQIAPAFASIKNLTPTDNGDLLIQLNLPRDNDAKFLRFKRIVNNQDTSEWITQPIKNTILDTVVSHNNVYSYIVQTVDEAGNPSISQFTMGKHPAPRRINLAKTSIEIIKIKESKKGVYYGLRIAGIPQNTKKIELFKKEGDAPYYEIGRFGPENTEIATGRLPFYTVQKWAIKITDSEGNKSDVLESEVIYVKPSRGVK